MKRIIYITLLSLISCQPGSNKKENLKNTEKNNSSGTNNSTASFQSTFTNKDEASIELDSNTSRAKNISYSEVSLDRENEFDYFIVKQTQEITKTLGSEGQDSKITLDIFSRNDGKLIKSISKTTDEILISSEYVHAIKYGCCGAEDYNELSSIWNDLTFLKYNLKYYKVEIPNAHINFYFGYLNDSRDESKLVLGELFLSHALPTLTDGKNFYSSQFQNVSKVIFKAKTKAFYDKIIPYSPEITLVQNTSRDQLIDYPDHQELRLWSCDNARSLTGIDFPGLKIQFEGDSIDPIVIDIPIKNGLLFGDKNSEQVIYVGK